MYSVYFHPESSCCWVDKDAVEHNDPCVSTYAEGLLFDKAVLQASILSKASGFRFDNRKETKMTKRVYIDFESRSQADIWECGAWVYSQHPSTEILCLCYAVDNGPIDTINFREFRSNTDEIMITRLNNLIREGAEFHAHNAYFERSMWKNILTSKYGALPIPIKQWRCTAAKASAHALPKKLEKAAEALETKFRKDMAGSKTMMYLAKSTGPIEPAKMERLIQYCKTDVEVEREIDQRLPDLDEKEQKVWFLDQYINDTGVCIDLDAVHKAAECVDKEVAALTAELNRLTGGEITAGTQRDKIKEWLEKKGVQLPNLQKKTVADALAGSTDDNKKVLLLRQQLSLTSNAKYNSLLAATSPDGRVRDILVYHGASTGRWSGKLVQIQNLVKPTEEGFDNRPVIKTLKSGGYEAMGMFYGDNMLSVLSSCIRGMFIPSPGHEMFITDFAAIEARVVMWLADDKTGLKMFEEADKDPTIPDIYVKTAWKIFRDQTLTKKDKPKRQVGKQTVLGCGFGMGIPKFQDTCDKYGVDLGPRTLKLERQGEIVEVSPLAQDAVNGYRQMFSKVVAFWTEMEMGAINCVRTKRPIQVGKILWYLDGEFLRMKLPIGRTLAYHRPKLEGDKLTFMAADPKTKRYVPERTWGGTLVENCLDKNTLVLTMRGWIKIIEVTKEDKVWDGKQWVSTDGVVSRGIKNTGWLGGIQVTADHKILVGNSWKRAIDMDEDTWQEALRPGLGSIASAFYHRESEMTAKPLANAIAAQSSVSQRDPFSEGKPDGVPDVVITKGGKKDPSIKTSCPPNYYPSGFIGIRAWFHDVIIQRLRRILTTAVAVLKSTALGLKTAGYFWNTRKLSPLGIIPDSIWTDVKTIMGMYPETSGLFPEKSTPVIAEIVRMLISGESRSFWWCFGKSFVLFIRVTTLSFGILKPVRQPKKLWTYIGESTEVYDLLNCGPENRFTIMSSDGPIIVHNCTQAVARDLMVSTMFQFASTGFRILFTVHDELVLEAPTGTKNEEAVLEIVRTIPSWAKGCPVNAECEKVDRYKK